MTRIKIFIPDGVVYETPTTKWNKFRTELETAVNTVQKKYFPNAKLKIEYDFEGLSKD